MNIEKAISIVTGVHWVSRAREVFKNTSKGLKRIADGGPGHPPRDPECKGKYRVYSHKKEKSFYADSFEAALNAAYSEADMKEMAQGARNTRHIQAYGAAIVCLLAVSGAITMHSIFPLFSIAPATLLLAFALRHGCMEESLRRRDLVSPWQYFASQGIFGLWK